MYAKNFQNKIMAYHNVTVLGGDWSGVLATKYMKEDLTVIVMERRDGIGGLWYYSNDPKEEMVMKSMHTMSSSSFTKMCDCP